MPTTWTIAIDWNRGGTFTDTYDDVTSRTLDARWFLGTQKPYQDVADNSLLTLVLDNSDKRFSPDNASSPIAPNLLPFRPVQIQSNDGTDTRTHWIGWIENIRPAVNQFGKRVVEIQAQGPMQFFLAVESKLPLQQNQPTDVIIGKLIQEVVIPPAALDAWILGNTGSQLGVNTKLMDGTVFYSHDAGNVNLDMAGDNWVRQGGMADVAQDSFDVYRAIRDITAAERGRFFFGRDGKAVFWNRHHLLDMPASPVAVLNNSMSGMEYTYANTDQLKNEVVVECHPRTISADSNQIMWQLPDGNPIQIDANDKKDMFLRFQDEAGKRVGGQNITFSDLKYDENSATVAIALDPKANGVNVTFTNANDIPASINSFIIRGQKITDSGQMQARATDDSSIAKFGRRQLKLNLPSVSKFDDAQNIAKFETKRRGNPVGQVASVKLVSNAQSGVGVNIQQVQRTLGDFIQIQEAQSAHDGKYYIIGEMHRLYQDGNILETTWFVEPAPTQTYWKLGVVGRSELTTTTRLAY